MKTLAAIIAAAALLPLAAQAQTPVTVATPAQQLEMLKDSDPVEAANKKLVYDFWREVFVAGDMSKLDQYMNPNYIQHNPIATDGRETFRTIFGGRGQRPVQSNIADLVAIMADGDLVTLAFRREMPNPRAPGTTYTTTWFDMLRIINGRIGEHWDYGTLSAPAATAAPARGATAAPAR